MASRKMVPFCCQKFCIAIWEPTGWWQRPDGGHI
jgi:hypothetical protein